LFEREAEVVEMDVCSVFDSSEDGFIISSGETKSDREEGEEVEI
jgi:hypothetical protein